MTRKTMMTARFFSCSAMAAVCCLAGCSEDGVSGHVLTCESGLCTCGSVCCAYDCIAGQCIDTQSDPAHCGTELDQCGTGEFCNRGSCRPIDTFCSSPQIWCDGGCVNPRSDSRHCGDCTTACESPEVCISGECAMKCADGYTVCPDRQCADLSRDRENCGACGTVCADNMFCAESTCKCRSGFFDCDGDPANGCESNAQCPLKCPEGQMQCSVVCEDVMSNPEHCGSCGNRCGAEDICNGGACEPSLADCSDGYEPCWGECSDFRNDSDNCGSCGNACKAGTACVEGECVGTPDGLACEGELTSCYGTCVDTRSDDRHCGACLNACEANEKCIDARCELQCGALEKCDGACIDTNRSAKNCGACGNACAPGEACVGGTCQCAEGRYDSDGIEANGCEATRPRECTPNETRACWRGDTDNLVDPTDPSKGAKGICETGTQTCNESGLFWNPCTGGKYPSLLSCDLYGNLNGLDNDCDGEVDTVCRSECDLAAGDMSYIGCEYWGAYIDNLITDANSNLTFVLSNPNAVEAHVYIYDKAQAANTSAQPAKTVTIAANDVVSVEMHNTGYNMCKGSGIFQNAYRLRSDRPITAYQFSPLGNPNAHSNDASLMLPANVLGNKYIAMTWNSESGNDHRSYIAMIATEPGTTTVTVKTSSNTLATETASIKVNASQSVAQKKVAAMTKGESRDFYLERFEVLTLMAPASSAHNQTGTIITSDKNIAVFGASRSTYVPDNAGCCRDHIEEQLFPTQAWGKSYLAARAYSGGVAGDFWVITARDDNTTIHLTKGLTNLNKGNAAIPETITLNAGETYPAFETRMPFEIHADKPISVGQFLPSQGYNKYYNPDKPSEQIGDPSFILTVPYEQYRNDYAFMVPQKFNTNYITIIAPKTATITFDNKVLAETDFIGGREQIGSSGFYVGYIQVYPGIHHMASDEAFGLYSYGYYNMSSYGYPIGLDLKAINTNDGI